MYAPYVVMCMTLLMGILITGWIPALPSQACRMIGLARYAAQTRVSSRKRSEKNENLPFG